MARRHDRADHRTRQRPERRSPPGGAPAEGVRAMRQLTSLDVQFLAAEDGRTHGHVSAVSILDPATAPEGKLTLADITRVFRERLHLLPPLCWRLVEVPLGLDYPRWLDDPD